MPTVLCIEPYRNPHIDTMYDEMARAPNVIVWRAVTGSLPEERLAMGWREETGSDGYLRSRRSLRECLKMWIAVCAADVVVAPAVFTMPFINVLRRAVRRPLLCWSEAFEGHPREAGKGLIRAGMRRVMVSLMNSKAVHLLAIGEAAAREYANLGATKWKVWTFGYSVAPVDETRYACRREWQAEEARQLLFVGSLIERKGPDLLLNALAQPAVRAKAWSLSIAGVGPMEHALRRQAEATGISDRVRFLGGVSPVALGELYSQADAVVVPSRFDGWAAVVNEAMEWGRPVLASTAVGAASVLIRDGESGFVFKSDSAESLAGQILRLCSDGESGRSVGDEARKRIQAHRPAAMARRILRLCEAIACGRQECLRVDCLLRD